MAQDVTGQQSLICHVEGGGGACALAIEVMQRLTKPAYRTGQQPQDSDRVCVSDAHLPNERSCGVLLAFALPVPPPEPVGGRKGLRLHYLRVIHVTDVLPIGLSVNRLSRTISPEEDALTSRCRTRA